MALADELREAVDSIPDEHEQPITEDELTCEELGLFLDEHPAVIAIADELGGFSEALAFMDEAMEVIGEMPTSSQLVRLFEKVHSPFKNKSSLTLDAHIKGAPNPRSDVGNWDCDSAGKYKQKCKNKKTGGTRNVDMSDYYTSGDKAAYMKKWRAKTASAGKK